MRVWEWLPVTPTYLLPVINQLLIDFVLDVENLPSNYYALPSHVIV